MLGAGLATLLAAALRPSELVIALLAIGFAWGCYALLNVNYGVFTLCLTAYIVFLLSMAGLPAIAVVHRRALCTALGGALAILAHLDILRRSRLRPESLAPEFFRVG